MIKTTVNYRIVTGDRNLEGQALVQTPDGEAWLVFKASYDDEDCIDFNRHWEGIDKLDKSGSLDTTVHPKLILINGRPVGCIIIVFYYNGEVSSHILQVNL